MYRNGFESEICVLRESKVSNRTEQFSREDEGTSSKILIKQMSVQAAVSKRITKKYPRRSRE